MKITMLLLVLLSWNNFDLLSDQEREIDQILIEVPAIKKQVKNGKTILKAIDLKIKNWANREILLKQLVKDLQIRLNSKPETLSEPQRLQLAELKELIKINYKGDLKAYIDSMMPKKINLTNKKSTYLIYFMRPGADKEEIRSLNHLQKEYASRGLRVVGVVNPLVVRKAPEGFVYPKDAPNNYVIPDPTFDTRNAAALLKVLNSVPEKMPRFLVGVDNDINQTLERAGK